MSTHLHPDLRHVLGLSARERIAFMDQPRWLGYPLANRLIEAMRGLMEKPSRPRMPNLLIVGESNNGKTTIVQRFSRLHGQGYVNEDAEPVKPIIVAQSPPSADEKGLYIAILESFWAPYRPTDPVSKLRYQVIHQLRACHTRLLIIDEFHSLLTGGAVKQRETMNAIKLLCNELMLPIVGVGTPDAVRVLHSDPQHASRFDVVTLPTWTLNQEFQHLLAGFEQTLPLKQASLLHEPEQATALHAISGGNLGDLHRLLIECANAAILSGTERIDRDVIQSKAWLRPSRGIREVTL
ncbi:TniB family NTP-binding protein [Halomonas piscis]|uniref:TniB family NTP-binding protein n=1 Tax=Halomonas piscis TaxID=3031727 RepID=UPI0028977CC4|nr:TniB family NTP-binding protein [Halomonas piscis]